MAWTVLWVLWRIFLICFHTALICGVVKLRWLDIPHLRRMDANDPLIKTPEQRERVSTFHDQFSRLAVFAGLLQLWGIFAAVIGASTTGFFAQASPAVVILIVYYPKLLHAKRLKLREEGRKAALRTLFEHGPLDLTELGERLPKRITDEWPPIALAEQLVQDDMAEVRMRTALDSLRRREQFDSDIEVRADGSMEVHRIGRVYQLTEGGGEFLRLTEGIAQRT